MNKQEQAASAAVIGSTSKAVPRSSLKVVLSSLEYENKRRAAQGLAPLSYGKYVAKLERR